MTATAAGESPISQTADGWTGHASIDSTGYRVVRAFHLEIGLQVFTSLTGLPPGDAGKRAAQLSKQFEGPLWRLVSERPAHLLALLVLLALAAPACGGKDAALRPRAQTWAELRVVRRGVTSASRRSFSSPRESK